MTLVRLINCNPSDDAEACGLPQSLTAHEHDAEMNEALCDAIKAARAALATIPHSVSVHLDSHGLISTSMEEGLSEADTWRDGTEYIIVYRRGGVFTRLTHDDSRQAEIEFEIVQPDGKPLQSVTSEGTCKDEDVSTLNQWESWHPLGATNERQDHEQTTGRNYQPLSGTSYLDGLGQLPPRRRREFSK